MRSQWPVSAEAWLPVVGGSRSDTWALKHNDERLNPLRHQSFPGFKETLLLSSAVCPVAPIPWCSRESRKIPGVKRLLATPFLVELPVNAPAKVL